MGDHEKALEYSLTSFFIKLDKLDSGENDPDTAVSYNNIGNLYQDKGDLEKALECYNKSLSVRLNSLGENHPDVSVNTIT